MNKIEDFTEGSVWLTSGGTKLIFHSFDESKQIPMFTSFGIQEFMVNDKGLIEFFAAWLGFKKYSPSNLFEVCDKCGNTGRWEPRTLSDPDGQE
jgi:hypothetical protein